HHAYVDKIFWRWQQLCPSYVTDYEGDLMSGQPVSKSLSLDSWKQYTAGDMLNTYGDLLCYTYTKSAGDTSFSHPACPDGSAPNYNPWSSSQSVVQQSVNAAPKSTAAVIVTSTTVPLTSLLQTSAPIRTTAEEITSLQKTKTTVASTLAISINSAVIATTLPFLSTTTTAPLGSSSDWLASLIDSLVLTQSFASHTNSSMLERRATIFARRDKPRLEFTIVNGANGTTTVSVFVSGSTGDDSSSQISTAPPDVYTVPAGCAVARVFFSHVSLLPRDEISGTVWRPRHGDHNPCPPALFPPRCYSWICERHPLAKTPGIHSKCHYASTISDSDIQRWGLDPCAIRRAECKMMWLVDECNAV
ncbi:hypothetical protein HDU83_008766, partial [Entophlyctis luteolus]